MKLKNAIRIIALHTWRTLEEVHDFVYSDWVKKVMKNQDKINKEIDDKQIKRNIIISNLKEIIYRESEWKLDITKWDIKNLDELYDTFLRMEEDLWTQKAYELIWATVWIWHTLMNWIDKLFSKLK